MERSVIFSTADMVKKAREEGRVSQLLTADQKALIVNQAAAEMEASWSRADEIAAQSRESAAKLILNA